MVTTNATSGFPPCKVLALRLRTAPLGRTECGRRRNTAVNTDRQALWTSAGRGQQTFRHADRSRIRVPPPRELENMGILGVPATRSMSSLRFGQLLLIQWPSMGILRRQSTGLVLGFIRRLRTWHRMQGKYGFLFSVAEWAGSPANVVFCQKLVHREEEPVLLSLSRVREFRMNLFWSLTLQHARMSVSPFGLRAQPALGWSVHRG